MKDPASISLIEVINAAREFSKKYNSDLTIPTPIEDIVEIQLDIKLILIQGLIRNCSVNAFITQDFSTIVVDEYMFSKQPDRIRFTIAEEMGHLFLHKDWYSLNGPKSTEDYLKFQETIDGNLYSFIERQAKTFAGMVLIPSPVIEQKWAEFAQKNSLKTPCSFYDLPDTFPDFARLFQVNPVSLLIRLKGLKCVELPDGFWKKIKK